MSRPLALVASLLAVALVGGASAWGQTTAEMSAAQTLTLPQEEWERDEPPVVTAVVLSPAGNWLATAGDDHVVRLWDVAAGKLLHSLRGHLDWVRTLSFHPTENLLVSAGDDRRIIWWDLDRMRPRLTDAQERPVISCVRFSPDGGRLAAVGFERKMWLYDGHTATLVEELDCPCRDMRALLYSPDGALLAGAGRNGKLRVWRADDGQTELEVRAAEQRIRALAFSDDGSLLATGGDGRELALWDIATGEKALSLADRPWKTRALAFCGPRRLAVGGTDNLIHILDLETSAELLVLRGHEGSVTSLAYDAARDSLISGSYDTTVRVWRLDGADDGMARRPLRSRQMQR